MDIITENKLLRENYALRQENDKLIERLKDIEHRAAGRSIAIAQIMGQASIIVAKWRYQPLHTDHRSDFYRGETSVLGWVFDRLRGISESDSDIAQIIKPAMEEYDRYAEYSRQLHAEANEQHFESMKKRALAKKKGT